MRGTGGTSVKTSDSMEEGPPVWQALWGLIGGKEGEESGRTTDSNFSMDPSGSGGKGVDEALEDLKRKQESSKQLVDLLRASRQKSPAGAKMTQLFQVSPQAPKPAIATTPPTPNPEDPKPSMQRGDSKPGGFANSQTPRNESQALDCRFEGSQEPSRSPGANLVDPTQPNPTQPAEGD